MGKRKHEEPGKPGRPTVLNPKLEAELLRLLSDAVSRRTACIRCGIGLSTFRDWMAKGKAEPQSEWGRFRHKVREAEAEAEIEVVRHIQEKALENAWLGMEWLKLRHPKRFNPKTKVELSGDPKRPLTTASAVDLSKYTSDDIKVIRDAVRRARGDTPGAT